MFDFRDNELKPISPYKMKEFLENVFSRETAEYIMYLDENEQTRINNPRDLNAEAIEHLCCHYDSSDAKGSLQDKIEEIKTSLKKVKSKNREYFNALEVLERLAEEVYDLSIVV